MLNIPQCIDTFRQDHMIDTSQPGPLWSMAWTANDSVFSFMIIVVFTAELGILDEEYAATSSHLRAAAFDQFGCLDFKSVEQDGEEITYSIWPDMDHVQKWSAYAEHLRAKSSARGKWYKSYRSTIALVQRDTQYP